MPCFLLFLLLIRRVCLETRMLCTFGCLGPETVMLIINTMKKLAEILVHYSGSEMLRLQPPVFYLSSGSVVVSIAVSMDNE
jgi:hypothetical protein